MVGSQWILAVLQAIGKRSIALSGDCRSTAGVNTRAIGLVIVGIGFYKATVELGLKHPEIG